MNPRSKLLVTSGVMVVAGLWLLAGSRMFAGIADPAVAAEVERLRPALSAADAKRLDQLADNIMSGGPPKDGIPAIDDPQYTTAAEADSWLLPHDVVFGLERDGFVAAYPQRILVWHEIVNDELGQQPVSITYCPLTGSAIGFLGRVASAGTTFGVSGKLVNSNLIMYDRATDSYWPQILGRSISGAARGTMLEEFPLTWTTWERWKREHPETQVLSRETGFFRDYGRRGDPYGSYVEADKGYYADEGQLLFNPIHHDGRLGTKAVVVGMRDSEGNALAVGKDTLRRRGTVEARLGDRPVIIRHDPSLDGYHAEYGDSGGQVNAFDVMWFAWVAFYPGTGLVE